jgi:hypothetical protein
METLYSSSFPNGDKFFQLNTLLFHGMFLTSLQCFAKRHCVPTSIKIFHVHNPVRKLIPSGPRSCCSYEMGVQNLPLFYTWRRTVRIVASKDAVTTWANFESFNSCCGTLSTMAEGLSLKMALVTSSEAWNMLHTIKNFHTYPTTRCSWQHEFMNSNANIRSTNS